MRLPICPPRKMRNNRLVAGQPPLGESLTPFWVELSKNPPKAQVDVTVTGKPVSSPPQKNRKRNSVTKCGVGKNCLP